MASPRDALITGIGLVSCLGEGIDAHWAALNRDGGFQPVVDATRFAPWPVHPMTALELDRQIPKRGDQRQMEAWQRIGTYAAGLALDSAGVKGNADLLSRMDMIVAAGGGERDYAVDAAILSALPSAADPGALPQRAPDVRPAAHAVPGAAVQPAGRQHLDRAWRGGLVAHLHGRGGIRHRCSAHRLCAYRRGTGRPVPGRRLLQRPAARIFCCTTRWAGCCGSGHRRRLGTPGAGRRHGAGFARLLPRDRKPRARGGARRHALAHIAAIADRPQPPAPRRGNGERRAPARRDAPSSRSVARGGDLRRDRRGRSHARGGGFPARPRHAGTRQRHRVRPLAGAVVPRQPGAGGDGAVAAAVCSPRSRRTRQPWTRELRQVLVTSWGHWRGEALGVVEAA